MHVYPEVQECFEELNKYGTLLSKNYDELISSVLTTGTGPVGLQEMQALPKISSDSNITV